MDAFFASVEQRDDPSLRGRPVLVGGAGPRGVVAAASYEARRFGCHSAQPMAVARRTCPHAVIVRPNGAAYRAASATMRTILESTTPLVEPISIDEAFLDVTGSMPMLGAPETIAASIRARIRSELDLTASVGVAPNKFVAKLASDHDKPDGLTVVRPEDVEAWLGRLPIASLWGVGPSTERRLERLGLRTLADVRAMPAPVLERSLGHHGRRLVELAWGRDDRSVSPDADRKSISQERTFGADLEDPEDVRSALVMEVESVAHRLREKGLIARGVTLKLRFGDFRTITRSAVLAEGTDRTRDLREQAIGLFERWMASGFVPIRLIGFGVRTAPAAGRQLALFGQEARDQPTRGQAALGQASADPSKPARTPVDEALDAVRRKYGERAIQPATTVRRRNSK